MSLVTDIKLIRTDTTRDLSQKAEKGMLPLSSTSHLVARSVLVLVLPIRMGQSDLPLRCVSLSHL